MTTVEPEYLLADARLSDEISPAIESGDAPIVEEPVHPRTVLLTGATGFVGAHVLRNLLDRGVERVVCLVRAADPHEGAARIQATLARLSLAAGDPLRGVVVVPSDLASPKLGLSDADFDALASEVDTIIHSAAWIHLLSPYSTLKAANVGGTQEILRLAVTRRLKRVCHISGLSVFLGAKEMIENAPPPYVPRSNGGYLDTKWVSDRLAWQAFERGVPGAVVRLGWISGDSRTGLIPESDALTLFLKACFRLGATPRLRRAGIACTPADVAAEVIVKVALEGAPSVRGYNLSSTHLIRFDALHRACIAAGVDMVELDEEEWVTQLTRRMPMLMPVAQSVLKEWDIPPIRNEQAIAMAESAAGKVTSEQLISAYLPLWRRERRPAVTAVQGVAR